MSENRYYKYKVMAKALFDGKKWQQKKCNLTRVCNGLSSFE